MKGFLVLPLKSDDIAEKTRLEKQIVFLHENSDIALVGSNIEYIDSKGEILYKRGRLPVESNQIATIMKYANVFNHPTLMVKQEILSKFKYRNLRYAQDYDMLCRMLEQGIKIANMSDYLLQYRKNENTNNDKRINQKVTMFCVQNLYKANKLSSSNIEKILEKSLAYVNKKKLLESIDIYDEMMNKYRKNQYFKVIGEMSRMIFQSRYLRKEILNLLMYSIYMRKYSN